MMVEGIVLFSIITVFSLVLLIVSWLSYWKYRNIKLLFIGMVFLLFFLRSILLSIGLFLPVVQAFTSSIYVWVFDLVILAVMYSTSLKK